MLHGALPEVLAGSGAVQPEDERVLLLPALNGEAQGARLHGRPRRQRRGLLTARREAWREAYLVVILHHHQCQFALLKIHFGNFRPGWREIVLTAQPAGTLPATHQTADSSLLLKLRFAQEITHSFKCDYIQKFHCHCQTPTNTRERCVFKTNLGVANTPQ